MIQYKLSEHEGQLIGVDFDNRVVEFTGSSNGDRDWMWFVEGEGKLVYDDPYDGYHFEQNVNEGDVIVLIYWLDNARRVVVIHDKTWYKLLKEKEAIKEERQAAQLATGDSKEMDAPCIRCGNRNTSKFQF